MPFPQFKLIIKVLGVSTNILWLLALELWLQILQKKEGKKSFF